MTSSVERTDLDFKISVALVVDIWSGIFKITVPGFISTESILVLISTFWVLYCVNEDIRQVYCRLANW